MSKTVIGEDAPHQSDHVNAELLALLIEIRATHGRPEHASTEAMRKAMVKVDAVIAASKERHDV